MSKNRAMAAKRTTGVTANRQMIIHLRTSKCKTANCENEVTVVKTADLDGKTKKFCLEHLTKNQDSVTVQSVVESMTTAGIKVLDIKNYFKA